MPLAPPPCRAVEALTEADWAMIQAALTEPLLIPPDVPDLSGLIAIIDGLATDERGA